MSSHDRADPQPDSTDKAVSTQICEVRSPEQLGLLIKCAIWNRFSQPGELIAIKVIRRSGGYEVKLKYENSEGEFAPTNIFQQVVEDYKSAPKPLYQNLDKVVPVEVLEASHSVLAFPAVIKLYHCGFSNINRLIQEALLQVRLASTYTCKLLDLFVRKGSKTVFQVGLVMERLEKDLEADIKHRATLDNHYTEDELQLILDCTVAALLYAKLRVRLT